MRPYRSSILAERGRLGYLFFFFSSRRRHTRLQGDWSSDVCSSDLGALTLVATHQPSLAWDLGETRGTVAVRMPLHPVALELLTEFGPMAVSSANLTEIGRASCRERV